MNYQIVSNVKAFCLVVEMVGLLYTICTTPVVVRSSHTHPSVWLIEETNTATSILLQLCSGTQLTQDYFFQAATINLLKFGTQILLW